MHTSISLRSSLILAISLSLLGQFSVAFRSKKRSSAKRWNAPNYITPARGRTVDPLVAKDQSHSQTQADSTSNLQLLTEHSDPSVRQAAEKARAVAALLASANVDSEEDVGLQAERKLGELERFVSELLAGHMHTQKNAPSMSLLGVSVDTDVTNDGNFNWTFWGQSAKAKSEDVQALSAWAAEIAGGQVRSDETHQAVGGAAQRLADLAAQARQESDGVDSNRQTFSHLLELFLKKRVEEAASGSDDIKQLASDYRTLQKLKSMDFSELNAFDIAQEAAGKHDFDLLLCYFQGKSKPKTSGRLQVLVFYVTFGFGHMSAANAISSALAETMDVELLDTSEDPTIQSGIKQYLTAGSKFLFNSIILRRQWYRTYNAIDMIQRALSDPMPCPAPICNSDAKDSFRKVILSRRPDVVVTTYHMELVPILEVLKDLGNIPLLHVATDMDLKMSEVFGSKLLPVYPRFLVGLPADMPSVKKTLLPVDSSMSVLIGYPVRSEFLCTKDQPRIDAMKAQIAPNSKVLLVMTGGVGQRPPWPEQLAARGIGEPLHIMIVAGREATYEQHLQQALPNTVVLHDGRKIFQGADQQVTVEVVHGEPLNGSTGYVVGAQSLVDLMDMADAIITKPGGGTTAEAAYRALPAVFDATNGFLHWEAFTADIFKNANVGDTFTTDAEFLEKLKAALSKPHIVSLFMDPAQPESFLDSGARIRAAVEQLLTTSCKHEPQPCRVWDPAPPLTEVEAK